MRSGNDNSEGGGDGHKDVKGIARGKAENTKGNEKIGAKTTQGSRRKQRKVIVCGERCQKKGRKNAKEANAKLMKEKQPDRGKCTRRKTLTGSNMKYSSD